MKNILVFGATGRTGRKFIEYALEKNYHVTAFMRNPDAFAIKHPNLVSFRGDILDNPKINQSLEGQDIVVSTLGARDFSTEITILSEGMKNILSGMQQHQIKRLLAIGGMGVLKKSETQLMHEDEEFPPFWENITNDHLRVFAQLQKSPIDWTFVCPPNMPDGARTGTYRTLADFHPEGGDEVSVEDVADFLLKELEANQFIQKRVGIAY